MSRDPYDDLIDQLLREILGGDRPRDITARVLAQAKIHDRFRRRWWVGTGSAIAACLAIAAGVAAYWPRDYPSPRVTEGMIYASSGGNELQRGQTVQTDLENGGALNIGNYVNLSMAPDTSLTLGGTRYQEKVFLDRGHVDIQVAKNKGKFDVAIGQALVHVTGTKFGLDVQDGLDETQTQRVKTLFVNVEEGSVDVQGVDSPRTLKAGTTESFVISSEPVPVIKSGAVTPPLTTATFPNAPRVRQGIGAGMQEGARIGNRGAPNRPMLEANAARGGLLAGQNRVQAAAAASMVRAMQMVVGTGTFERTGSLRMVNGWFYLETEQGNYILFPQASPTVKDFKPVTDHPVHVVWQGGSIKSIAPVTTSSKPV